MREPVVPDPGEQREPLLDDADRQSIREWFRKLASLRGPTRRSSTAMTGDEETRRASQRSAGDLFVPRELAADVKGGTTNPPGEPTEPPAKPKEKP